MCLCSGSGRKSRKTLLIEACTVEVVCKGGDIVANINIEGKDFEIVGELDHGRIGCSYRKELLCYDHVEKKWFLFWTIGAAESVNAPAASLSVKKHYFQGLTADQADSWEKETFEDTRQTLVGREVIQYLRL
jgi:hypothetical protein